MVVLAYVSVSRSVADRILSDVPRTLEQQSKSVRPRTTPIGNLVIASPLDVLPRWMSCSDARLTRAMVRAAPMNRVLSLRGDVEQ